MGYYQWVVFFLFVQAMLFHIPRSIWKGKEGGLMKMLVKDMTNPAYLVDKIARQDQISYIIKYFKTARKNHGGYALNFFLCEVLALINVIGQIYFTDRFLGYTFTTYGWDVHPQQHGSRGESRSDEHCVPQGCQMHFPQVRSLRHHREQGWSLHPRSQHHQREDLCLLVVLVCCPCSDLCCCPRLPRSGHLDPHHQGQCRDGPLPLQC